MENMNNTGNIDRTTVVIIFLGIISLILEYGSYRGCGIIFAGHFIDVLISMIFVGETTLALLRSPDKKLFIRKNSAEIIFLAGLISVFLFSKYYHFFVSPFEGHNVSTKLVIILSLFNVFKVIMRIRRLNYFFKKFYTHPAQTILMSFVFIILVGTILLMMPVSSVNHERIGFLNSLFTATSSTCVTGLVVLDTASDFSLFGKIVIMLLIQVGGLGIMVLAFFGVFIAGRKISLKEKMAMSYMLNETDSRNLSKGVKNIVLLTFLFESTGAVLLFIALRDLLGLGGRNLFYSLFHSISAFCNAGFSLFPGNLDPFKSNLTVNFIIAGLIIAGGISFVVILDSFSLLRSRFKAVVLKKNVRAQKLSLNSSIVLTGTLILLVAGTLLIYKLEHKPSLLQYNIKTQYLMAFFQSVSLRTAGFNTMDISTLHKATYFIMMLFMFIGGASGSIAGGIKINTIGVIWAYLKSIFTNRSDVVLMKNSINKDQVNQAFLVVFLSLSFIFTASLILAVTESKRLIIILFEAFSAFGTVGLSAGLTPVLTPVGKVIITALMFIGRLGPLTVVMALSQKTSENHIQYPSGQVSIG